MKEPLPFCLNPAKGNSRKIDVYDLYKDRITAPILNQFRSNIYKNLDLAGLKSLSSKEAVCKNETQRFQWSKQFICPIDSRMIQTLDDRRKLNSVALTDYPSSFESDWTDQKGMILYYRVRYELKSYNFRVPVIIFISIVLLAIISWRKTFRICSLMCSGLEFLSPSTSRIFQKMPKRLEENHPLLESDDKRPFQMRKLSIN